MDTSHRTAPVWLVYPLCLLLLAACGKNLDDQLADARLQQEIGSFKDSIATLQEILNDHPDHAGANLLLGTAQVATNQPALAIWPLEVAARDPEHADTADLALGAAYLRLEQTDAALAAADRVLARDPEDPSVRMAAITIRASANLGSRAWDATLEDVGRLLAVNPESPEALVLKAQALMGAERVDEAELALRELWDHPTMGRTPAAGRAGISLAKIEAYRREDLDAAEKILEELLARFPQDATVLGFVTDFLDHQDRPEVATKLLREALERDPGDLNLRGRLADNLVGRGEIEEAEKLVVEGTELFDSPPAWLALSDFHAGQGHHAEALAAFERMLELLPGTSDVLRFRYADLLAAAGELDRAESVARDIEGKAYRSVVLGQVAYLRGEYAEALEHFDAGLREWPNNAGARYLAARSALGLGDVERAIDEYREAVRVGLGETSAGLELGVLLLELKRPRGVIAVAGQLYNDPEFGASPKAGDAAVLLARAHWMDGQKGVARGFVAALAEREGYEQTAAVEGARFDAEEAGPKAGATAIAGSGLDLTDPDNEKALRLASSYWVAAGQADVAAARVRAAAAAHPEHAGFHDLVGRLHVRSGRSDQAAPAFERALELDSEYAPALEGMGSLRLASGDAAGARDFFDRAAGADESNAAYPYQAAQIELAAGRTDAAEERLRDALRRNAAHANACNDLAWILADRQDSLDEALRLATRASESDPSASVLDTLGWVHFQRAEYAEAASALERARGLDAGSPSIAYRLALAFMKTGETDRAADLFREALASGPFPEAEAARTELSRIERGNS